LAGGLAGRRAGERPEIRGGADVRGQVGSERRRKGLTHGPGLAATEKEERGECRCFGPATYYGEYPK
jgi:hypothetical protein